MANTPNLDLVKPAGTDHALVSVINSNSDKIDAGVGTLSEQIAQFEGVEIAANTDLNSLRTPGFYYSGNTATTSTITNKPDGVTAGFTLEVAKKGSYVTQLINYGNALFIRESSSGGFSAWAEIARTPVVAYTATAFSINTNSYGVAAVPSASVPTVSGRTRVMLVIGNFTSSDLSVNQIPPTVVETSSGNVFVLGSPSKTYTGLQLKGLFI